VKLFIAITGNISSGKSSLLASFTKLGINTYSCDKIVEKLYSEEKTIGLFKKNNLAAYVDNKIINKKLLFKKLFKNKELKKKVESIVHPLVINELKIIKKTKGIKIVEVPLLFEANILELFDAVLCVYIDELTQVLRLIKKYNIDKNTALNIINSQIPIKYKILESDYIINNNKDLKSLANKAKLVLCILKKHS